MFSYFQGVFREFGFIRWLSFKRVSVLTVLVLVIAVLVGFALGYLDNLFAELLSRVIV